MIEKSLWIYRVVFQTKGTFGGPSKGGALSGIRCEPNLSIWFGKGWSNLMARLAKIKRTIRPQIGTAIVAVRNQPSVAWTPWPVGCIGPKNALESPTSTAKKKIINYFLKLDCFLLLYWVINAFLNSYIDIFKILCF